VHWHFFCTLFFQHLPFCAFVVHLVLESTQPYGGGAVMPGGVIGTLGGGGGEGSGGVCGWIDDQ